MSAHLTTIGPVWALVLLATYPLILVATRRRGEVPRRRTVAVSLLFLYALGVVIVTIFPITVQPSWSWTSQPWWSVVRWIPFDVDALSFGLNVTMFVPFGVLVPLLWRRADSVRRLACWAACASGGIELVQFVLWLTLGSRRTVDLNDLIANTVGALLGLLALRVAVPLTARRAGLAT